MTPAEKLADVLQAEGVRLWRYGIVLRGHNREGLTRPAVIAHARTELERALEHAAALEVLIARIANTPA